MDGWSRGVGLGIGMILAPLRQQAPRGRAADTADETSAFHLHVDRRGHEEFDAATEGMDVDLLILSDHSLAQVQPDAAAKSVEPGAVLSASAEPLRVRPR